jgi:hypothetical protein
MSTTQNIPRKPLPRAMQLDGQLMQNLSVTLLRSDPPHYHLYLFN